MSQFLNWVEFVKSVEDEQEYIESLKTDDTTICCFAILYEDKVIGTVGFLALDRLNKNAELGYCIDQNFQKKGIVTKACKSVIKYGFDSLNLERIEFRIVKDNFKSKSVMKRLSAVFEGVLRNAYLLNNSYVDREIYSLLKSECES